MFCLNKAFYLNKSKFVFNAYICIKTKYLKGMVFEVVLQRAGSTHWRLDSISGKKEPMRNCGQLGWSTNYKSHNELRSFNWRIRPQIDLYEEDKKLNLRGKVGSFQLCEVLES